MDTRKLGAEFLGTFWLVFGGCGSVLFSVVHGGDLSIDILGIALAFGLTVVTGAYAFGPISGGHFNPAVTLGLVVGRRFEAKDLGGYWAAQVLGAIAAAAVLWLIASGVPGFEAGGFASNGYGDLSPGKYSMLSALVAEVVLTAFFLLIILGATDKRAAPGFAGLAIGLALCLIHIVGIPIDGVSVNPARSTGTALFAIAHGNLAQLWLFWVAPLAGGALGGLIYPMIAGEQPKSSGEQSKA